MENRSTNNNNNNINKKRRWTSLPPMRSASRSFPQLEDTPDQDQKKGQSPSDPNYMRKKKRGRSLIRTTKQQGPGLLPSMSVDSSASFSSEKSFVSRTIRGVFHGKNRKTNRAFPQVLTTDINVSFHFPQMKRHAKTTISIAPETTIENMASPDGAVKKTFAQSKKRGDLLDCPLVFSLYDASYKRGVAPYPVYLEKFYIPEIANLARKDVSPNSLRHAYQLRDYKSNYSVGTVDSMSINCRGVKQGECIIYLRVPQCARQVLMVLDQLTSLSDVKKRTLQQIQDQYVTNPLSDIAMHLGARDLSFYLDEPGDLDGPKAPKILAELVRGSDTYQKEESLVLNLHLDPQDNTHNNEKAEMVMTQHAPSKAVSFIIYVTSIVGGQEMTKLIQMKTIAQDITLSNFEEKIRQNITNNKQPNITKNKNPFVLRAHQLDGASPTYWTGYSVMFGGNIRERQLSYYTKYCHQQLAIDCRALRQDEIIASIEYRSHSDVLILRRSLSLEKLKQDLFGALSGHHVATRLSGIVSGLKSKAQIDLYINLYREGEVRFEKIEEKEAGQLKIGSLVTGIAKKSFDRYRTLFLHIEIAPPALVPLPNLSDTASGSPNYKEFDITQRSMEVKEESKEGSEWDDTNTIVSNQTKSTYEQSPPHPFHLFNAPPSSEEQKNAFSDQQEEPAQQAARGGGAHTSLHNTLALSIPIALERMHQNSPSHVGDALKTFGEKIWFNKTFSVARIATWSLIVLLCAAIPVLWPESIGFGLILLSDLLLLTFFEKLPPILTKVIPLCVVAFNIISSVLLGVFGMQAGFIILFSLLSLTTLAEHGLGTKLLAQKETTYTRLYYNTYYTLKGIHILLSFGLLVALRIALDPQIILSHILLDLLLPWSLPLRYIIIIACTLTFIGSSVGGAQLWTSTKRALPLLDLNDAYDSANHLNPHPHTLPSAHNNNAFSDQQEIMMNNGQIHDHQDNRL